METWGLIRGGSCPEQEIWQELERSRVTALVGGGGKTSLLCALGRRAAGQGKRVILTTTTHLRRPDELPLCRSWADCGEQWRRGSFALWCGDRGGEKLEALSREDFTRALVADLVLVEADGARMLPCKVPADHEPAIPKEAELVLGVMGLDAWDRPIREVCHRWELACERLGCTPEHRLTAEDMARILCSDWGTARNTEGRSYFPVLNKCDNEERRRAGEEILRLLWETKRMRGILTCVKGEAYE